MSHSGDLRRWRKAVEDLHLEEGKKKSKKPYATMSDKPKDYLYRKDGKQKLVGSVGGNRRFKIDDYQYESEEELEGDEENVKIWHHMKAPGEDWEVVDASPYMRMTEEVFSDFVEFHKRHGRWPNQEESYKLER